MIYLLPNELLYRIFNFLNCENLKQILLVCRKFRTIGEMSDLWRRFKLKVINAPEVILKIKRFNKLSFVNLVGLNLTDSVFRILLTKTTTLLKVVINKCNISTVSPVPLANLVNNIEAFILEVNYEYIKEERLTSDQCYELFSIVSTSDTKLKELHLGYSDCSNIDADTFAKAIIKIKIVDIYWSLLTRDQADKVIQLIKDKESRLQSLQIGYNDMSNIQVLPDLFGEALCDLNHVNLYNLGHSITTDKLNCLFEHLGKPTNKLTELNLGGNNMRNILPKNISSVAFLNYLNLDFTKLSIDQSTIIFEVLVPKESMKYLSLSGIPLCHICPVKFTSVLSTVEIVRVNLTSLTIIQLRKLIHQIVSGHSNIRSLDISNNDLSLLDSNDLAKAINTLENAVIHNTELTAYQVVKLLKLIPTKCQLKSLDISGDLSPIDPMIISTAFTSLEKVVIRSGKTLISTLANKELFTKMADKSSCLLEFDLQCRDLSKIDPKIMARAVNNLMVANLMDTNMTRCQIESIFQEAATEQSRLEYLDVRGADITVVDKKVFWKAKSKVDFIFHDFDDLLSGRIYRERIFGNFRR